MCVRDSNAIQMKRSPSSYLLAAGCYAHHAASEGARNAQRNFINKYARIFLVCGVPSGLVRKDEAAEDAGFLLFCFCVC